MSKLLDDDDGVNQNNKENKKKLEEFRKTNTIVDNQKDFLMFLMNKKSERQNTTGSSYNEIMMNLNQIQNKLESSPKKKKKKKYTMDSKTRDLSTFLNKNLFKNYEMLNKLTQKHNIKTAIPIISPNCSNNTFNESD